MVFSSRSTFATVLNWSAEVLSDVLQCFPAPRTSRRESGWFGADLGDAKRENSIMGDLELVRVWFTDPKLSPEAAVWHHDLDGVVKVIVPLPCREGHKQLADLAVDKDGVERVLTYFEAVRSRPIGNRDPMVLAQRPRDLTLKRVEACKQLRDAYHDRLAEENFDNQDLNRLGRQLDAQCRTWLERRLQSIVRDLDNIQNSVQTVRIWYPVCQGPLAQDAKDKGVGDMILAEVQLEDPSNRYAPEYQSHRPAGAILVDLAILPENTATVRSKYLPVEFAPFSGHDPLVWSEPGDDIDLQRALALRRVLSRYDKAQRIRQSQGQIPEPRNELISNWFSKRMTELEGWVKAIHGCETVRAWCCSDQQYPMANVRSRGLHDVVRAAVPLQAPNYRQVANDKTVHPDGAILVDLAVLKEGVHRVLRQYRPTGFLPMSSDDPVVLSQPSETMEDKQIAAYEDMLERYSHYLREDCRLLSPIAKVWVAERLVGIDIHLSLIHPSHLEVIQKLGLGDVVKEAVPLKVPTIFQESVQVDLAIEPSGISNVRRLCELVEFQRLSEDDAIIQMQPDGDPRVRMFNGYNHILWRYAEARALRQVDGALMLWYEKEIGNLESLIGRVGWSTCRKIHCVTGWMAVTLLSFHIVVAVQAREFAFPLSEQPHLFAMLAAISLAVLALLSIPWFRHWSYETFLRGHQILAGVSVYGIWKHLPSRSQLIILLYRNGLFAGRGSPRAIVSFSASESKEEGTVVKAAHVRVLLPRPVKLEPGQYINLWMPSVSLWSWMQTHPFTVTSWSKGAQDTIELLVKPRSGLTADLLRHADVAAGSSISFLAVFTGPHGVSEEVSYYESVLVLASGSGIATAIPYLKKMIYGYNTCTSQVRRLHLVWQVESVGEMTAALALLNNLLKDDIMDEGYILHISIYVRNGLEQNKLPFGRHERVYLYQGVPDYQNIIPLEASGGQIERLPNTGDEQGRTLVMVSATDEHRDNIREILVNRFGGNLKRLRSLHVEQILEVLGRAKKGGHIRWHILATEEAEISSNFRDGCPNIYYVSVGLEESGSGLFPDTLDETKLCKLVQALGADLDEIRKLGRDQVTWVFEWLRAAGMVEWIEVQQNQASVDVNPSEASGCYTTDILQSASHSSVEPSLLTSDRTLSRLVNLSPHAGAEIDFLLEQCMASPGVLNAVGPPCPEPVATPAGTAVSPETDAGALSYPTPSSLDSSPGGPRLANPSSGDCVPPCGSVNTPLWAPSPYLVPAATPVGPVAFPGPNANASSYPTPSSYYINSPPTAESLEPLGPGISDRTKFRMLQLCRFGKGGEEFLEEIRIPLILKAEAGLLTQDSLGLLRPFLERSRADTLPSLNALGLPVKWMGLEGAASYYRLLEDEKQNEKQNRPVLDPLAKRIAQFLFSLNYEWLKKRAKGSKDTVPKSILEACGEPNTESGRDNISGYHARRGKRWRLFAACWGAGILLRAGDDLAAIINSTITKHELNVLISFVLRTRPGSVRLFHLLEPVVRAFMFGVTAVDLRSVILDGVDDTIRQGELACAYAADQAAWADQQTEETWLVKDAEAIAKERMAEFLPTFELHDPCPIAL
ncbi:hypothetical protein KXW39_000827 [Aspergillus fumigatus]|nr:hypothetical protein KXW39_000827 [Aspergillus fumigatus]